MKIQKVIITIVIALIIALLGVGVFTIWLLKTSPQQSSSQEEPTVSTGGTTSINSNPTASGVTNAPAEPDPKKSYDTLFKSLGAVRLGYELVGSEEGHFGDVYKLYASDIALSKKVFPNATSFTIEVGSVDLDGDGINEIVVYENLPGMCGTGGCTIDVYKKHNTLYENILSTLGFETVGVSTGITSGYKDLLISHIGETGFMSSVVKYSFSGSAYAEIGSVATWDGQTFVSPTQP
jgi:hypothetical protein